MMPTKVVFWGAGGHAIVCAEILSAMGDHELAGCLEDSACKESGHPALKTSVVGTREHLPDLQRAGVRHAFVAIGDCLARLRIAKMFTSAGFTLVSLVHPRAVVSASAAVGEGTVLMAGAIVNAHANIGANVILNTACSVDHDCQVSDGVHISPGAHLAGRVKIGTGTWVGLGASVCGRVEIGSHSIVGAGAVVIEDIPANVVVVGVPARIIRKIEDAQP